MEIQIEVIRQIKDKYSLETLKQLYREDDPTLSVFSKKAWQALLSVAFLLAVSALFLESFVMVVVSFILGTISASKISKITSWRKGALEGIESAYEYSEKNLYLDFLKNNMEIKNGYLHLWGLLYPNGCWWENNDDQALEKYLQSKITEGRQEINKK